MSAPVIIAIMLRSTALKASDCMLTISFKDFLVYVNMDDRPDIPIYTNSVRSLDLFEKIIKLKLENMQYYVAAIVGALYNNTSYLQYLSLYLYYSIYSLSISPSVYPKDRSREESYIL
jgi:hypothetical protein